MSRQQLYALVSLATAVGIAGYYLLAINGLSGGAGLTGQAARLFIRVILIATLVQFILDIAQSIGALSVDKDERDRSIDGRGYRNGYYVLIVVVFTAIGHLAVSALAGQHFDEQFLASMPLITLHILVLGSMAAVATHAATRLYFYNKGI
ncbi:MAG: hypothetical protein HKN43_10735 [Rhodothermales bacterium]|nr:hypothetical protein [Rhodothermales bacterium]